jgi:hypothetical protein
LIAFGKIAILRPSRAAAGALEDAASDVAAGVDAAADDDADSEEVAAAELAALDVVAATGADVVAVEAVFLLLEHAPRANVVARIATPAIAFLFIDLSLLHGTGSE